MARCEECGSHQVAPCQVEGVEVEQCALCGHLQGDDRRVAHAESRGEARARGMDPEVYPLVRVLEAVPTFRVDSASGGDPSIREYPFVFLRLEPGGLHDLERLLTALEMANHATRRRWVVECALQRGLLFILRPRFWKAVAEITTLDITDARHDLGVLAATLEKNVGAAWWAKR